MYLNKPVAYLTNEDIDDSGKLSSTVPQKKPIFLMIQASFCSHCTTSKPAFQKAADNLKNKVFFTTIQGDGKEPGEPVTNSKMKAITGGKFLGYPSYALYKNGKWTNYEGGRDEASIVDFLNKNA